MIVINNLYMIISGEEGKYSKNYFYSASKQNLSFVYKDDKKNIIEVYLTRISIGIICLGEKFQEKFF